MNKKLLSAAIGAILASSIGIAQADVQLFGQVDASIDSHDCDAGGCSGYTASKGFGTGDNSQKMNMNGNFSYFGIRGGEDLGNGMKAIFNVMFAFDPAGNNSTGGSNTLSDNEKWLGLAGEFGRVRVGTVTTPYSDHGAKLDPFFGTSLEGHQAGLQSDALHSEFSSNELSVAAGGASGLVNRTIRFDSMDMNGLSASAFYTLGGRNFSNSSGNTDNPYGLGVQYKNGNILAFFDALTSAESSAVRENNKAWDLGGQYTMGNLGMFGMYERGGLVGGTAASGSSANAWHLGGSFTMGNTLAYLAYGKGDADTRPASFSTDKYSAWTLGVKHSLSTRTNLYVGFNQYDRDVVGQTDHFAMGMNVKF